MFANFVYFFDQKIRILGAGLSGLTAVIKLAKADFEVEVFERGSGVGCRFGGDVLGIESWSEKEGVKQFFKRMNLEINFDLEFCSQIWFTNDCLNRKLSCSKPPFNLDKRESLSGSLDRGLKKQALGLGVGIRLGQTMPGGRAAIIATAGRAWSWPWEFFPGLFLKPTTQNSKLS
ncbi:MAG: NAD(P)-binding protein [Candidatus Pacebacteria bacterium]|nr:NAD(P)-binding protein [Candidatus Paceibacterota bacterium]